MATPQFSDAEVNVLAAMNGQEAASWMRAAFQDAPPEHVQIMVDSLAELKRTAQAEGSDGGPHHLAYDHAMAGLARLEHRALASGDLSDVGELLHAVAQLGPEAAGFKADVIYLQTDELAHLDAVVPDRPLGARAEYAGQITDAIVAVIRSDPVNVVQALETFGNFDQVLGSMLIDRSPGTGTGLIGAMAGDIISALVDAVDRGDKQAASGAAEAVGFLFAELAQAIRSAIDDDRADIEWGAQIVQGTLTAIGLLVPGGFVAGVIGIALQEAVSVLENVEKESGEGSSESFGDALNAGLQELVEPALDAKGEQRREWEGELDSAIKRGEGEARTTGGVRFGEETWADARVGATPGEDAVTVATLEPSPDLAAGLLAELAGQDDASAAPAPGMAPGLDPGIVATVHEAAGSAVATPDGSGAEELFAAAGMDLTPDVTQFSMADLSEFPDLAGAAEVAGTDLTPPELGGAGELVVPLGSDEAQPPPDGVEFAQQGLPTQPGGAQDLAFGGAGTAGADAGGGVINGLTPDIFDGLPPGPHG